MGFVRKVYGILTAQILLTVMIALAICSLGENRAQKNEWFCCVCAFSIPAFLSVVHCCLDQLRKFPQNYVLLFLFTACEGGFIGVVVSGHVLQSVLLSAAVTVLVFLAMTAYACFTKTDFTGLGPYMFAALTVFLMFGLSRFVLRLAGVHIAQMETAYSVAVVLLFTFFIVFDTHRILGEWGGHRVQFLLDDYCFVSLSLYIDIITIFPEIFCVCRRRR